MVWRLPARFSVSPHSGTAVGNSRYTSRRRYTSRLERQPIANSAHTVLFVVETSTPHLGRERIDQGIPRPSIRYRLLAEEAEYQPYLRR